MSCPGVAALLIVFVVSLNQCQIFYQLHRGNGQMLIDAAHGVLSGHPPWKAFQARLLGPGAYALLETSIMGLQRVAPSLYAVYERIFSLPDTRHLVVMNAFATAMILICNFTCFGLLWRYKGNLLQALGGTLLGSILFVMLSDEWLYTWDFFELIVFTILAYWMFTGQTSSRAFLLLFAFALPNRESAAFLGVWLLCVAICTKLIGGRFPWGKALLGLALIAVAVAFVGIVRDSMLIESTLGNEVSRRAQAVAMNDGQNWRRAFGNHLLFLTNAFEFVKNLVSTRLYIDAFVMVVVSHGVWLAQLGWRERRPDLMATGLFGLFLLASIVNFALLNEARLYLICVPILVFSAVTFSSRWLAAFSPIDSAKPAQRCWTNASAPLQAIETPVLAKTSARLNRPDRVRR